MTGSIVDRPPGKALRFGLRLPVWLYRLRLGWMLGDRFLMLTHKGRKSGLPRQAVIEVVQHDKETDTYYVVSGWGRTSDWYQNIRKDPSVTIHAGARRFRSQAEFIPAAKAVEVLEAYVREHPRAFQELTALFLGDRSVPGSEAARRLAEKMPMVAFHPEQELEERK
jgi:deazaflavin-dependent oxidoreductase (nitroreductase family)